MSVVELSFTPLPEHVRAARMVTAAVARDRGFDEATVDDVRLAVGEACSRAVVAAVEQGSASVIVRLVEAPGALTVEVVGPGELGGPAEADVELVALGLRAAESAQDLALALMGGLTDRLEVVDESGCQVVRLSWDG